MNDYDYDYDELDFDDWCQEYEDYLNYIDWLEQSWD